MQEEIFRKKSIDRVASPEALDDYVKVASPGIWMLLVGIIILLISVCIWGVVGHLDTKVSIGVVNDGNDNVCYISESNINKVKIGQKFMINGTEGEILKISSTPVQGKNLSPLMLHALNIGDDDWAYEVVTDHDLGAGEYESYIVTESVSPMSFIFN